MSSLARHEGWLFVDHSASPGLTEAEARFMGYDPAHCREGKIFENATLTCAHCGNAYIKNPDRTRDREYCRACDHYICDFCGIARQQPGYTHIAFKQKVDILVEMAVRHESLGSPLELVDPSSIVPPTKIIVP